LTRANDSCYRLVASVAVRWSVPTLADVVEARRRIAPHLQPTPLYTYAALDELLGCEVYVKHENHQPTGAFKVRGGVNLVGQLTADERRRGVIAASTGNHGQSVAFAARLFGVRATICVPEEANPVKVAAVRGFGAELVVHGRATTTHASMPSASPRSTDTGTCILETSPC
jgi:threonine dehydratase